MYKPSASSLKNRGKVPPHFDTIQLRTHGYSWNPRRS